MHPMLNIAIRAARKAGQVIARGMDELPYLKIYQKGPNDYCTNIDKKAEAEIIKVIHKAYPDHGFCAEESGIQQGDGKHTWIIDPIDGTANFMRGLPHFAVSIALKVNDKIEQGVVYDPIRQELFVASLGKGAHLNDRRIRIKSSAHFKGSLLSVSAVTNVHNAYDQDKIIHLKKKLQSFEIAGLRHTGSAALNLAYIAASRIDGFCEMNLKIWDVAAGSLIVQEAGGFVSGINNKDYLESGEMIAANPKLFPKLQKLMTEFYC